MPPFNDSKREKFCQLIVSGKTQTEAYIESRPNTVMRRDVATDRASKLAREADVMARIAELRAPVIEKVQKKFAYTLEDAMAEIGKAEDLARAMLQPQTILAAVKLKAQLQKLLVSVRETRGETPLDEADTAELMELLKTIRAQKGGSEKGPGLRLVK